MSPLFLFDMEALIYDFVVHLDWFNILKIANVGQV